MEEERSILVKNVNENDIESSETNQIETLPLQNKHIKQYPFFILLINLINGKLIKKIMNNISFFFVWHFVSKF
jgi:hypothetical protein